jgi:hypothetical protein
MHISNFRHTDKLSVWPSRLGSSIPVLVLLVGLIRVSQPAFATIQAATGNQDRSRDPIIGPTALALAIFLAIPSHVPG